MACTTSLAYNVAWNVVGANEWMNFFFSPNNTIKLANHNKSAETLDLNKMSSSISSKINVRMKFKLSKSGLTEVSNQPQIIYFSLHLPVDSHSFPLWPSLIRPVYQWFWWQYGKEIYEIWKAQSWKG